MDASDASLEDSVPIEKAESIRIVLRLPDASIRDGLAELASRAPRRNVYVESQRSPQARDWLVSFELDKASSSNALAISASSRGSGLQVHVRYRRDCEAYRALGHVLAVSRLVLERTSSLESRGRPGLAHHMSNGSSSTTSISSDHTATLQQAITLLETQQTCAFDTLGIMVDCSRNGVLLVSSIKDLLRNLAMMGCNMLQLYTEIEGEPFFGYFRGGYSQAELREIDAYAARFDIEVIPCIQTLGHLAQMLQWPRFYHIRDTHDVLLAGAEETYNLIEKMIRTATAPFRSKRIHIGMDEAFGLAEGRYKQLFGSAKDPTVVFTDHLRRVNDICKRLQCQPMIWADMLFCLQARDPTLAGYYNSGNPATPQLVAAIPSEVELVYWDYYHTLPESYASKITEHWELARKPPWMASGQWTWNRFWTALPFTFKTVRASMVASKQPHAGVKRAMTTIWGDEGNECDIWSALPSIWYFAEHAYTPDTEIDFDWLAAKFDGACGGDYAAFVEASNIDDTQPELQPSDHKARLAGNMSKWLLWEDPAYSFLAPQYLAHYDLESHYANIASKLQRVLQQEPGSALHGPLNEHLRLPLLISEVLALKTHLRAWLQHYYRTDDRPQLTRLAGRGETSRLGRLRQLVDELWRYHRQLWMSTYKPFGWETLELRYGGLRARLETLHVRLCALLEGEISSLPELEVDTLELYPGQGLSMMLDYSRASRPTYI